MTTDQDARLREALARIAEIAAAAAQGEDSHNGDGSRREGSSGRAPADADLGCRIKVLPDRLRERAAETARSINPVNAPLEAPLARTTVADPLALTVSTSRYWGPAPRRFTVSFVESTPADLRARLLEHMNAWNASCGMSFVQTTGTGEVRISRGAGGYWSYLGTDVRLIPANRPTMNLQGFTMNTSEQEYRRVVRHETGHTLGFPHEHMRGELVARIDPEKAYRYFRATQGWDRAKVDAQVLTPLRDASIFGTPADQDSIMCYQLPGQITVDGLPIRGGLDINTTDANFAALIYPPATASMPGAVPAEEPGEESAEADDWDESDDRLALAY
jgi:hypothetical protein